MQWNVFIFSGASRIQQLEMDARHRALSARVWFGVLSIRWNVVGMAIQQLEMDARHRVGTGYE